MALRIDDPRALYLAAMREDFGLFLRKTYPYIHGGDDLQWNWHLDAIAHQLSRVSAGDVQRMLFMLPPRHLKSFAINVAWVAWRLGRDPTLNFVCVSYSDDLALKPARDCRKIMQSGWYKELFPGTVIARSRSAVHDFETTRGGGRFSTSIKGTITGRGGDVIIIDDPIKPDEAMSETTRNNVNESFPRTVITRLDDKEKGAILCVMQRLHEEDLVGVLLARGGWEQLCLPAIATEDAMIPLTRGRVHMRREGDILHPARESLETLMQLKAILGSSVFSAQYQQQPVPAAGNMAKAEWILQYTMLPRGASGLIVQSWDTASKDGIHNDWSVCVTAHVHRGEIRILHVFRERLDFVRLKSAVIRLAREWNPDVLLVEDAASGTQLINTLRNECPEGVPRPIGRKPEGDKVTRFASICAQIEAGQLLLPEEAPWLADFKAEILGFPNARYDDQADALAQLMIWAARQQRADEPGMPPEVYGPGDDINEGFNGQYDENDPQWRILDEEYGGDPYEWDEDMV